MSQNRRIAQRSAAAVDQCPCGTLVLHVGPVSLRMPPDAMRALLGLLDEAVDALDQEGGEPLGPDPDDEWIERIARRGR